MFVCSDDLGIRVFGLQDSINHLGLSLVFFIFREVGRVLRLKKSIYPQHVAFTCKKYSKKFSELRLNL